MSQLMLSSARYQPQGRPMQRSSHNTIIEDSPQELCWSDDDFTPRQATFDDLYDVSDDENGCADIPIVIAVSPVQSRKQQTLEILSPTAWPTARAQCKPGQEQTFDAGLLSPTFRIPQVKLSLMTDQKSLSSSGAPSLDGSLTSDELASFSCPSTPDIVSLEGEEDTGEWTLPAQLQPSSMTTLGSLAQSKHNTQAFALHQTEMAQKGVPLALDTKFEVSMTPIDGELSAISMPSPGGFLSSSDSDGASSWISPVQQETPALPTAVAANFYGVPFMSSPKADCTPALPTPGFRPQHIDVFADTDLTEGPPTARRVPAHWNCGTPGLQALKSPDFLQELNDFNENYERQLRESSSMNIDRTASWLDSCHYAIEEEPQPSAPTDARGFPADNTMGSPDCIDNGIKDNLFFRGFQYIHSTKQDTDAFVHRKTRTEKLRLDRKCLFTSHVNQLEGKYIMTRNEPASAPDTKQGRMNKVDEKSEQEEIAIAVKEQDALRQLEPVSWNVEATKYLNGGTLLTSPTAKIFRRKRNAKVLDLGGVSTCDWSWQLALEHPDALVHTVCTTECLFDENIATPKNHKQSTVDNLWTLPFANDYFDCVSARNIYSLLKLCKPSNRALDEYDLCLKECMRVLRPGGYLEFQLFDADIMNAGDRATQMNIQFSENLRIHGYDPSPTKTWLNRVRKQGFESIRRAWLVLPMTQHSASREGTTADASHMTGMVGSWAYERWMLKLNKEMGKQGSHLLEGVVPMLEEGARIGAGWRCLSGWARKPF